MIEDKRLNISLLSFLIIFVLLTISYIGAEYYCYSQSKKLHTFSFSKDNTSRQETFITVQVSKYWDDSDMKEELSIGAQYDGVIINSSKNTFKDWAVTLKFSDNLAIDSSWNGTFSSRGNKVVFVAEGDPAFVLSNSLATFGAVMYSDSIMSLSSYELSGYYELLLKDLSYFWLLVSLTILWFMFFIIYIGVNYKTVRYNRRLELDSKIILQSMNTLVSFIDAKDPYTRNHSTRVAIYSSELGRLLKMNKIDVKNLYYIALMHDCGKIGIPDELLNKKIILNEEEYKVVQSHCDIGRKILSEFTAIPNIRNGAFFHHKRFDGKGYPRGLKGLDIPLCSRIICVADAYDAMSSTRCYRNALSRDEILSEMINNSGSQFDPEIASLMISLIENGFVEKIIKEYPNLTSTI